MRLLFSGALLHCFVVLPAFAAAHPAQAAPPQENPPQEARLKVSVDQVRVDVLVTDKRGRVVPGLRAEDFEVYQDGELQQITNLVFIEDSQLGRAPTDAARPVRSGLEPVAEVPVPHLPLQRHQVKRAFALVVDDLGLSFESLARTRHILIRFIREQIQPGDLVAIVRTSQAVGALQQFTSDRNQLEAAAKRLRFSFRRFSSEVRRVHTLSSLLYIINGLKDLPGRKSIIFLSDGLSMYSQDGLVGLADRGIRTPPVRSEEQSSSDTGFGDVPYTSLRLVSAMQRVVDAATRAFVSVYAIDARGLVAGGFSAADDLSNLSFSQISNLFFQNRRDFFDSQSGLAHLAHQTGGLFYRNNNNLRRGIEQALEDQRAYYLISYQPPPENESDSRRNRPLFRRIQVKVKPDGLRVRHRAGFLALPDSMDLLPGVRNPWNQQSVRRRELLKVLSSPFAGGQLEVKLSSLYFNDSQDGDGLRVLAYVAGRELDFQEETTGDEKWHTAPVDVLMVLSDLDGQVQAVDDHTFVLNARGHSYQRLRDEGVIFPRTLSIEKYGGYHLKVAVRDPVSGRGGSAAHFVEIPRFRKKRLALSGLGLVSAKLLQNGLGASEVAVLGLPTATDPKGDEAFAVLASPESPAVRRYPAGSWLTYSLYIYNARLDSKTRRPRLTSRTVLFREGREVFRGEPRPVETSQQEDMRRLWLAGRLGIPTQYEPGGYILQIIVKDELAGRKKAAANQWIDFEVLPPDTE